MLSITLSHSIRMLCNNWTTQTQTHLSDDSSLMCGGGGEEEREKEEREKEEERDREEGRDILVQ